MDNIADGANNSSFALPKSAPELHKRLLQKWLRISQNRPPVLNDFDFGAALLLPHDPFQVEMIENDTAVSDFNFGRLSPSAKEMYQRDFEGANLRVVMGATEYARTATIYQTALDTFTPHYWEKTRSFYGREPLHFLRLVLPLRDENGEAKWLFGSLIWFKDRSTPLPSNINL